MILHNLVIQKRVIREVLNKKSRNDYSIISSVTFTSLHMKIGYFSDSNTVYNMLVIKKNELKIELQKQHPIANATSDPSSISKESRYRNWKQD